MAIGVLEEAARRGCRVPEDLSVVGFDGVDAADWTQPLLTTVEQPIDEIAETAVGALRRLIDDPHRPLPHYVYRPLLRGLDRACRALAARSDVPELDGLTMSEFGRDAAAPEHRHHPAQS